MMVKMFPDFFWEEMTWQDRADFLMEVEGQCSQALSDMQEAQAAGRCTSIHIRKYMYMVNSIREIEIMFMYPLISSSIH